MKNLILVMSFLYSSLALSQCFKYDNNSTIISWTAFQTPAKIGVSGKFEKFSINPKKANCEFKKIINSI